MFESELNPFRSVHGGSHKRMEDVLEFFMVLEQTVEHLRPATWMIEDKIRCGETDIFWKGKVGCRC